jgi:hypothetical protein
LELTFDGVAYILVVRCASGDCLEVMAERKEDASTWSAVFAAKCASNVRGLLAVSEGPALLLDVG